MSVRYYKKLTPANRVQLTNGQWLQFDSLDTLTGYFATDSEYVQQQFAAFMQQQRYAISEIPFAEFEAEFIIKKKNGSSRPLVPERESIGGSMAHRQPLIAQIHPAAVENAVGVKEGITDIRPTLQSAPPPVAPAREEFKPTVGKRIARRPRPE